MCVTGYVKTEKRRAKTGKTGFLSGLQGVLRRNIEFVKPFGTKGYRRFLKSVTLGAGKKKWSGRKELNLRPLRPERSALNQAELRPDFAKTIKL